MGHSGAWIAGSYQSDFARHYAREGLEISDMVGEAVAGTLEAAGLPARTNVSAAASGAVSCRRGFPQASSASAAIARQRRTRGERRARGLTRRFSARRARRGRTPRST